MLPCVFNLLEVIDEVFCFVQSINASKHHIITVVVASGSSFGKGKRITKVAEYVSKLRGHAIQQGEPPHAIADPAIRSRLSAITQYVEQYVKDGKPIYFELDSGKWLSTLWRGHEEAGAINASMDLALTLPNISGISHMLNHELASLIQGVRFSYHQELLTIANVSTECFPEKA